MNIHMNTIFQYIEEYNNNNNNNNNNDIWIYFLLIKSKNNIKMY
jgi:hypothetical protein